MSVEKVSGKMNVSLGESVNVQPIKNKKTPEQIKDGKKKLALALGALAVAGAVTAGVVIGIKKGKLNNSQINNVIKESADDISNAVKNSADDVNNAAKESFGYFNSFDDFKKIGTFDKGKALIDGKNFSGIIHTTGKNGQTRFVTYENGFLSKVSEQKPNTKYHVIKEYIYAEDGTKTIYDYIKQKVTTINPDKSINIQPNEPGVVTVLKKGKIRMIDETEYKPIVKDGKTIWHKIEHVSRGDKLSNGSLKTRNFKKITDLSTGKTSLEINNSVQESPIKVPIKLADGRKGKALYSGKELVRQEISTYDPATKTVITEHIDPNNPNLRSLYIFDKSNKNWPDFINIDKTANKAYATNRGSYPIPVSNEGDLKDLVQWSQNWIDALKNFMKKYN